MMNLLLTYKHPLQQKDRVPYSGMACDGRFCYACHDKTPVVYRFQEDGALEGCISVQCCYHSLCYDPEGDCFWATDRCRKGKVLKLSRELEEIDCISVHLGDVTVNSIACGGQNGALLLTSMETVYLVSQKGAVLCRYKSQNGYFNLAACGLCESIVKTASYQYTAPNIVQLLPPSLCSENITCLPEGHMCSAICPVYRMGGSSWLYMLTVKKSRFSYLLKYQCVTTGGPQPCLAHAREADECGDMVCIQEITI